MASAPAVPSSIAFFDVDETLLSVKSMFEFYEYFLEVVCDTADERQKLRDQAGSVLSPGIPREEANRLFYRRFAGYAVAEVAAIGRRWFDARLRRGGLFHTDVVDALRGHRALGTITVLVSGSFSACLAPVRAYCEADLAIATQLEARDGIYTGEVTRTMIGAAKVAAARALISEKGVAAADCHAYGDHTSDLGLLRLVGHPVVVGANPEVVAIAETRGWRRLRRTPG